MQLGFIGLGIMGKPMARHLLNSGYSVVVYNRSPEKAESLGKEGAQVAASPYDVAQSADVVFTMLANPEAVKAVAQGENGLLNGLEAGKTWVDASTVNPSFSLEMAEECKAQRIRFMDAPVAGSKGPAENGELVFLVGGSDEDLETIRPYLDIMGKAVNHVGENGKGTSMKMVVNLLLGQSMMAFTEALNLGEALGIEQDKLMNTLVGGPVTAPFLQGKQPKIQQEDYTPEFPLQWMHKDLHLVTQTAYEAGIALPATSTIKEAFGLAKASGNGEKDFSAVYDYFKKQKS